MVNSDKIKCILSRKAQEIRWKQYLSIFGDFSGVFRCVFGQLLLIQTLFSVQLNIRRIITDFLRDSSACPVLCKTLRFSGLRGGGGGGGCLKRFT